MKICQKSPILVGEWFKIKLDFFNEEASKIQDCELNSILLDSQDPLIGDTTCISYDPGLTEESIKSPSDENVEAFSIVKSIGKLEPSKSLSLCVYIKASTTGIRNLGIRVKYKLGEEFTLCSGPIRILDCRMEPRFPVQPSSAQEGGDSSLKNSVLYQKGSARDCFCLTVRREDLSNQLDAQDITIGKYFMEWRREEESDSLTYSFSNLTDKIQEYALSIEASESFLISGNKAATFKIIPHDSRVFSYVLQPLKAGPKVPLPKLNLRSLRLAQGHD
ncbi:Uncharacterized protein FKW44_004370, partial [Caligus rogercresseyi]